mgnify:CR=1 FL=1
MKRKSLAGVLMAMVAAATSLAAAEPNAVVAPAGQKAILSLDKSYWRMHLTHRKPKAWVGGAIVERLPQTPVGGLPISGVETGLPAAGWELPEFDDSEWIRRKGPLFGEPDMCTANMSLVCLRGRFTVNDPKAVGDLTVSVAYRGGVVVYVNGKEVARGHLEDKDKKGLEALAEDYPEESAEDMKDRNALARRMTRRLDDVKVPVALLKKGMNILAIENHRSAVPKGRRMEHNTLDAITPIGLVDVVLKGSGDGIAANIGRPKGLVAWAVPACERVTQRDYGTTDDPGLATVEMAGARNGISCGYIGVSSDEAIAGLKAEASDLKSSSGAIAAKQIDIHYPLPDGRGGLMREFDHSDQRVKAFFSLDSTPPESAPFFKEEGGSVQTIWVTVRVPKDARPGEYSGNVTITAKGVAPVKMPVKLTVADMVLPDPRENNTNFDPQESWESVAMQYKVPLWSERHWQLLDKVFELMGRAGGDSVYLLLARRTHFGNSESMVRWIRKEDGGYAHDFSVAEKYVDLAIKHLGKPSTVCLVAWDICDGAAYEMTPRTERWIKPKTGVRITILDPKTGKTEEGEGPQFGTPESPEFWKPVYDGIVKLLKAKGIPSENIFHGIIGDCVPTPPVLSDMSKLMPGAKWVTHNHPGCRVNIWDFKDVAGREAYVYVMRPRSPKDNDRRLERFRHGWKNAAKYRSSWFPRDVGGHYGPQIQTRTMFEKTLVTGLMGLGRTGFNFWDVTQHAHRGSFGEKTLCNRYPENDWGQTSIIMGGGFWITAGKDGPVSTLPYENLILGAQESEARILIEKALIDPAQRAKLGEEFARKCQELLDERQEQMAIRYDASCWSFNSWWWERSTLKLYNLAAEVAKKIGG